MQTTSSDTTDEKFALVRGVFGVFFVVLLEDSTQEWAYKPITTGTLEEMKALKKLMDVAHANN